MSPFGIRSTIAICLLLSRVAASSANAQELSEEATECLSCHSEADMTLVLGDGSELRLQVDAEAFMASVHGASGITCTDCHGGYADDHPFGGSWESERAYVISSYDACKECHFDTYTRTLESVHYELVKDGFDVAPVCTDCHGAHDVHDPHVKRAMIDRSCAKCHDSVFEIYGESVHGRALSGSGDNDVPGCADCHESHSVEHPSTVRFRLKSPEKCIRCHGDPELMAPHDISTYVATSYLTDFHGVTASLAVDSEADPRQVVVTCIDCHGHHSIGSPEEIGAERMKAKVASVCAECHEGASPDFPAAWLSHYEPSLTHAPLVFLVNLFYWIVIPFVVIGLALQVVLHLFRVASGR